MRTVNQKFATRLRKVRVLEARARGISFGEIAKEFGVTRSRVWEICRIAERELLVTRTGMRKYRLGLRSRVQGFIGDPRGVWIESDLEDYEPLVTK